MDNNKPPSLTGEYYKARRQLVLWSGIFFIWQTVGIDIPNLGGSAGILGSLAKALESPEYIPWIMFTLVLYFIYRFVIEWYHCPPQRRDLKVSQIDFSVGILISSSSVILYLIQLAINMRLVDMLFNSQTLAGLTVGCIIVYSIILARFYPKYIVMRKSIIAVGLKYYFIKKLIPLSILFLISVSLFTSSEFSGVLFFIGLGLALLSYGIYRVSQGIPKFLERIQKGSSLFTK